MAPIFSGKAPPQMNATYALLILFDLIWEYFAFFVGLVTVVGILVHHFYVKAVLSPLAVVPSSTSSSSSSTSNSMSKSRIKSNDSDKMVSNAAVTSKTTVFKVNISTKSNIETSTSKPLSSSTTQHNHFGNFEPKNKRVKERDKLLAADNDCIDEIDNRNDNDGDDDLDVGGITTGIKSLQNNLGKPIKGADDWSGSSSTNVFAEAQEGNKKIKDFTRELKQLLVFRAKPAVDNDTLECFFTAQREKDIKKMLDSHSANFLDLISSYRISDKQSEYSEHFEFYKRWFGDIVFSSNASKFEKKAAFDLIMSHFSSRNAIVSELEKAPKDKDVLKGIYKRYKELRTDIFDQDEFYRRFVEDERSKGKFQSLNEKEKDARQFILGPKFSHIKWPVDHTTYPDECKEECGTLLKKLAIESPIEKRLVDLCNSIFNYSTVQSFIELENPLPSVRGRPSTPASTALEFARKVETLIWSVKNQPSFPFCKIADEAIKFVVKVLVEKRREGWGEEEEEGLYKQLGAFMYCLSRILESASPGFSKVVCTCFWSKSEYAKLMLDNIQDEALDKRVFKVYSYMLSYSYGCDERRNFIYSSSYNMLVYFDRLLNATPDVSEGLRDLVNLYLNCNNGLVLSLLKDAVLSNSLQKLQIDFSVYQNQGRADSKFMSHIRILETTIAKSRRFIELKRLMPASDDMSFCVSINGGSSSSSISGSIVRASSSNTTSSLADLMVRYLMTDHGDQKGFGLYKKDDSQIKINKEFDGDFFLNRLKGKDGLLAKVSELIHSQTGGGGGGGGNEDASKKEVVYKAVRFFLENGGPIEIPVEDLNLRRCNFSAFHPLSPLTWPDNLWRDFPDMESILLRVNVSIRLMFFLSVPRKELDLRWGCVYSNADVMQFLLDLTMYLERTKNIVNQDNVTIIMTWIFYLFCDLSDDYIAIKLGDILDTSGTLNSKRSGSKHCICKCCVVAGIDYNPITGILDDRSVMCTCPSWRMACTQPDDKGYFDTNMHNRRGYNVYNRSLFHQLSSKYGNHFKRAVFLIFQIFKSKYPPGQTRVRDWSVIFTENGGILDKYSQTKFREAQTTITNENLKFPTSIADFMGEQLRKFIEYINGLDFS